MKDFRDSLVWRKAHELTLDVYRITCGFPHGEQYGLTSQLRRASASVAANLAEGCARVGDAEFARFCSMAMGSASETEYHLLLAMDLNLIEPGEYKKVAAQATEVKRMLSALVLKLRADR